MRVRIEKGLKEEGYGREGTQGRGLGLRRASRMRVRVEKGLKDEG